MFSLTEQAQIDFRNSVDKGLHPPDEKIKELLSQGLKGIEEYRESWYQEWCDEYDRKRNEK